MEFILLLLAPMKPKPRTQELMRERIMSHVKQLGIHEAIVGKRRHANPEEEAQRKQQKCDMRKQAASPKPVSYTQAAEATTNHENDNEPRRTASITKIKPTRESDGASTLRTKLNRSRRSAIYANRSSKPVSYTHTDQELQANQSRRLQAQKSERRS